MQLNEVDIPNHTKRKITESIRRDIPELVKYKLQTMIMKDKLYSNISDLAGDEKDTGMIALKFTKLFSL